MDADTVPLLVMLAGAVFVEQVELRCPVVVEDEQGVPAVLAASVLLVRATRVRTGRAIVGIVVVVSVRCTVLTDAPT